MFLILFPILHLFPSASYFYQDAMNECWIFLSYFYMKHLWCPVIPTSFPFIQPLDCLVRSSTSNFGQWSGGLTGSPNPMSPSCSLQAHFTHFSQPYQVWICSTGAKCLRFRPFTVWLSKWCFHRSAILLIKIRLMCLASSWYFILLANSRNDFIATTDSLNMTYEHTVTPVWITVLATLCLIDFIFYVFNEQHIQGWAKGLITLNTIKQHFKILLTSSV